MGDGVSGLMLPRLRVLLDLDDSCAPMSAGFQNWLFAHTEI